MREEYIFNIHTFICAYIHMYMHAFIKMKNDVEKKKEVNPNEFLKRRK